MLDQMKSIKQAWDMRQKMQKIQKELGKKEIVVERSGISITITGTQEVRAVVISEDYMQDRKKLEIEMKHSINKAIGDSQQMMQKEMQAIAGDLNIPGLG